MTYSTTKIDGVKCSSCCNKMDQFNEPDCIIFKCSSCDGVLLDKNALSILYPAPDRDIAFFFINLENKKDEFPDRLCPTCNNKSMKKVHFAAFSDYILDYCHECGSMFFDKNEFNVTKDNFARITGNNSIRTYEKDRFLSIEKLLNSVPFGRSESLSTFFRVTLFFKSPLSFSLRITKEKWLTKFQKVFGILKGKDIEIWDPLFDQKFLIQGDKEHKIRQLLNNKYLKGELVKLFEKRFSIVHLKGTIEITESGLRYCEGPYGHIKELNLKNATRPIVDEFMHIADIIEELDH